MRETDLGGPRVNFEPTAWSLVRAARGSRDALDELVRAYWKPAYFFVRRKGYDVEDAKDLTQEFFARLLEKRTLDVADPGRGKFRTFLLTCLENFLRDEHGRRNAKKRKPRFDFVEAETQFRPDQSFERDWATAVLERAFERLKAENPAAAAAARGKSADKVAAHRARKRLREILLDELRATVETPADAECELADLFKAFSL